MTDLILRDDLVERLNEIARRENRPLDDVVEALLEQYQIKTEAAWEEEILTPVVGNSLKSDGSIDFDMLRTRGKTITLTELYGEGKMVF